MTIKDAIEKAKREFEWSTVDGVPFTAAVGFINNDGREDETSFDLWNDNPVNELDSLWNEMAMEFDASLDSVTYVESHDYGWI